MLRPPTRPRTTSACSSIFRPEVGGGRGGDMRQTNIIHARPTTFRPFSTMIERGWWSRSGLEALG